MSRTRGAGWVLFLALTAYANSLGNGFAYDDVGILVQNPLVSEGRWQDAFRAPWWPKSPEGAGLYRPITSASFALEWKVFEGHPMGFHALNIFCHATASVLVFLLLGSVASWAGALAGGVWFAIHPVHTEAVANVVGRAELYAAISVLAACLLYWWGSSWRGWARGLRLAGLAGLYALALGSKESGVTLPALLLLLELFRGRPAQSAGGMAGTEGIRPLRRRLWEEVPTFLLLGVVLAGYLGVRYAILGSIKGERVAPVLEVVGGWGRVLTAVALWVQYLRLVLFPADLSADYDPGVLFPSENVDGWVLGGAGVLLTLGILAWKARDRYWPVTLGILWFGVTILPVSNLLFPTGVLLAERTLYLPSVGTAVVLGGVVPGVLRWPPLWRRWVTALALVLGAGFFVRTVLRNPAWLDTFVVQQVLHEEHPESWRAIRARAQGLERVGEAKAAAEAWDLAVRLAPMDYTLLVQAGDFHGRRGDWEKGAEYLSRAIAVEPRLANAYQILATYLLRQGRGRDAHRVSLEGLARSGPDPVLWALVSESYILKGDLAAAIRAREAAASLDPENPIHRERLGELVKALEERGRAEGGGMPGGKRAALPPSAERGPTMPGGESGR